MEKISKNTKTGSRRTTGYGYIVYNYNDAKHPPVFKSFL